MTTPRQTEPRYLFVGQYRDMLDWARKKGLRTRDLIHAAQGGRALRGLTGPVHIVTDVPPGYELTDREDQALYAASIVNSVHGHKIEPKTIDGR